MFYGCAVFTVQSSHLNGRLSIFVHGQLSVTVSRFLLLRRGSEIEKSVDPSCREWSELCKSSIGIQFRRDAEEWRSVEVVGWGKGDYNLQWREEDNNLKGNAEYFWNIFEQNLRMPPPKTGGLWSSRTSDEKKSTRFAPVTPGDAPHKPSDPSDDTRPPPNPNFSKFPCLNLKRLCSIFSFLGVWHLQCFSTHP